VSNLVTAHEITNNYHTEKKVDKIEIMFENIKKFLE